MLIPIIPTKAINNQFENIKLFTIKYFYEKGIRTNCTLIFCI